VSHIAEFRLDDYLLHRPLPRCPSMLREPKGLSPFHRRLAPFPQTQTVGQRTLYRNLEWKRSWAPPQPQLVWDVYCELPRTPGGRPRGLPQRGTCPKLGRTHCSYQRNWALPKLRTPLGKRLAQLRSTTQDARLGGSNPSHHRKDDDDQQNQSNSTARVVAPTGAVGPKRK
jgi:hypothetical protein